MDKTKNTVSEFIMIDFKGIVHPKMKILSLFTHPQVVPNLYVFICSAEHKGRRIGSTWKYLEEQISIPIDFHSRKKYILC